MKIAILSDIHDHTENLERAIAYSPEVEMIICCGDLCSPFMIVEMGKKFSGPIHVVFGNNDGDLFRITTLAIKYPNIKLHGEYCELEIDGLSFAVNHFDNIGSALARGEVFDVVCCGHNHKAEIKQVGKTLMINPGEIYGKRTGTASFAIFDTKTRRAEKIEI